MSLLRETAVKAARSHPPVVPRYGTLAASSSFISARPIFRAPIPQALRGERQYLRKEKPRTRRRGFFFAKQARANRRRR